MNPNASYVRVSEDHRDRWSTFEDYQPLIALLYLAAIDENAEPTDGYTTETRLEHFIDELAHIGRAHNWDNTRPKPDGTTEEFDDLTGDRPSCFSGVKRRLFQSVQGHPLFKVLTKETIDQELRDFVRQHVQSMVTDENRGRLKAAWEDFISFPDSRLIPTLKELDIPEDQQQAFIQSLELKYGQQFTQDPRFLGQVLNAFSLTDDNAHLLKFGHVQPQQFFEPTTAGVASSGLGLFAETAPAPQDENQEPEDSAEVANKKP